MNLQSVYNTVDTFFNSNTPQQNLQNLQMELLSMKRALTNNPNESIFKNKVIELTCKCGEFYLQQKDYDDALKYFEEADQLASDNHYLKLQISVNILSILEQQIILEASMRNSSPK